MSGEEQGALPPELEGALNRILEHPEILSAVASAFGKSSQEAPSSSDDSRSPPAQKAATDPSSSLGTLSSLAPLLSGLGKESKGSPDREDSRSCLLIALKPYVNEHRRQAIDTMLRFSQISELLGHMGQSNSNRT